MMNVTIVDTDILIDVCSLGAALLQRLTLPGETHCTAKS
jgi:hypothetical protein